MRQTYTVVVMLGLATVILSPWATEAYCVDDSWRDEVATGACTGLQDTTGWMFAVRRDCFSSRPCTDICNSLAGVDSEATRMWCADSLHVTPNTHPLERELRSSDVEKLGIKVYRYFSCSRTDCGPNYCCCQGRNW